MVGDPRCGVLLRPLPCIFEVGHWGVAGVPYLHLHEPTPV